MEKKIFVIDCVEDVEQNIKWFICDVLDSSNCFTTKEEAEQECRRRNAEPPIAVKKWMAY